MHLVNVSNRKRDVVAVRGAPAGSRICRVRLFPRPVSSCVGGYGARSGYAVEDIVLVIAYYVVEARCLRRGDLPWMRVCFLYEVPPGRVGETK